MPTPTNRLRPVIGLGRLIGVTFAVIAPSSSVFLTYGAAYARAGTGVVLGYAVGSALNLLVMLAYAEVGSVFPEAGGDYSLAARALGPRAAAVFAVLFGLKGVAIPALLALSAAAYFHVLLPVPVSVLAMAALVLCVTLASLDLQTSSTLVNLMVAVEAAVFGLFLFTGLASLHQPWTVLLRPVVSRAGRLSPVAHPAVLAAATAAVYGLNGPQACLYYSEETRAEPRAFGRAILGAALATIAVELLGVVVTTLALPSLALDAHQAGPVAVIEAALAQRPWVRSLLVAGIGLALFDTGLATTMAYGRIFYAVARDGNWPRPINRYCLRVSPRGAPIGALLVLGTLNLLAISLSGVSFLVLLTGSVLLFIYLGIALAALTTRLKTDPVPFRMPGWPLPPLGAIAALFIVLTGVPRGELALALAALALGLIWAEVRVRSPA